MHIPDGFLDAKTLAVTAALSVGGLVVAARQVSHNLPPNKVPLMGLGAAFVFAAQMINFPVAGGTSGHLLGGVLTAVLLGPGAAAVVITCVLVVQALLFSDGGLLALGANIFNMAFISTIGGWFIYKLVSRTLRNFAGQITAIFFAAWCSVILAALACAGELSFSGTVSPEIVFPAMAGVHLLIGIGEGLITSLVVLAVHRTRPELLEPSRSTPNAARFGEFAFYGLLATLGLVLFVSPYASAWPDGLDKVAAQLGFAGRTAETIKGCFADYQIPGVSSMALATGLAGLAGAGLMFSLAWLAGHFLALKRPVTVSKTSSQEKPDPSHQ